MAILRSFRTSLGGKPKGGKKSRSLQVDDSAPPFSGVFVSRQALQVRSTMTSTGDPLKFYACCLSQSFSLSDLSIDGCYGETRKFHVVFVVRLQLCWFRMPHFGISSNDIFLVFRLDLPFHFFGQLEKFRFEIAPQEFSLGRHPFATGRETFHVGSSSEAYRTSQGIT